VSLAAASSLLCASALQLQTPVTRFISDSVTGLCDSVHSEAGYFDIVDHKKYFYWAFESRNNVDTDPVFIWLTGGPGCSSQVALFHENGPCKVANNRKTTIKNPYSWNNKATVIYIDQPAGVGFSTGPVDDSTEVEVADDLYIFLQEFFKKNEKLQSNEFYIVGESYGGHYVPNIAARVVLGNQRKEGIHINLKGAAIGNGLTDPLTQYGAFPDFSQQNGYRQLVSKFQYGIMKDIYWPTCQRLIEGCYAGNDNSCVNALGYCQAKLVMPQLAGGLNQYDIRSKCEVPPLCYDMSDVQDFLDQDSVRSALGVGKINWESCNMRVNTNFQADFMKGYQDDATFLLENGVRVLIYAGDADLVCNWLSNQAWTLALEWSHKDAFNAAKVTPWMHDRAEAGSLRSANGLSFLRVYEAGHMVPMDQPGAALEMINAFFGNTLA